MTQLFSKSKSVARLLDFLLPTMLVIALGGGLIFWAYSLDGPNGIDVQHEQAPDQNTHLVQNGAGADETAMDVYKRQMPNGVWVTCIVSERAMSCDWDGSHQRNAGTDTQ